MRSFKVKGKKLALTEHFWEPGIVQAFISLFSQIPPKKPMKSGWSPLPDAPGNPARVRAGPRSHRSQCWTWAVAILYALISNLAVSRWSEPQLWLALGKPLELVGDQSGWVLGHCGPRVSQMASVALQRESLSSVLVASGRSREASGSGLLIIIN